MDEIFGRRTVEVVVQELAHSRVLVGDREPQLTFAVLEVLSDELLTCGEVVLHELIDRVSLVVCQTPWTAAFAPSSCSALTAIYSPRS